MKMSSMIDAKRKSADDGASPNKRPRAAVDPPAPSARRDSNTELTGEEGAAARSTTDVASKEEVLKFLLDETVILDVRTAEEVVNDGFVQTAGSGKTRWLHVSCTREDSPLLRAAATHMIADPKTPIIVYCKSGKRASKAQEILNGQGYKRVINAGGYKDLNYLQEALDKRKKEG